MAEADQIPRAGAAEGCSGDQPLDVMHVPQEVAQLGPLRTLEREVFDGVEPVLDPRKRHEWPEEPGPQQPAAHGRHRAIDRVQERPGPAPIDPFDDVQVAQRHRIDEERIGGLDERDVAHMRQVAALGLPHVRHDGPSRRHRSRGPVEPEAGERGDAELFGQGLDGAGVVKRPGLHLGDARADALDERCRLLGTLARLGDEEFFRPQERQFGHDGRARLGAGQLGREKGARGDVEPGHAPGGRRRRRRRDRHEKRGFAGIEVARVREGPGRDDPGHLPADEALGLAASSTWSQMATR